MTSWDTSCVDWEQRLLEGKQLVPDLPLFRDEAERALRIFKRLRVPDLHGLPRMEDVAGPWLYPIVESIFGSYDAEANRRMIQEFFWLIPKKNGKSSTAAAIMVEALILNRRPEGEYVLVAPTKEVSDIAFKQAAGTIRADAELEKLFHIQNNIKLITNRLTGATLKVKAADTDVITGGKQLGTLIDELHVLSAKKEAADIMVELRGALAARPDGFLITITTQSKSTPSGVFKSELQKARDVRDGKLRMPLLPILYELPRGVEEQWRDKKYWTVVNPNLGRSVDEGFLDRELVSAENEGPAQLALFASQHFNVEIGLGLRTDGWAGAEFWQQAGDKDLTLEELVERSDVVTVGVDGGGLDDLFGLAVIGRDAATRQWMLWNKAWCHKIVLERRKQIAARLLDFQKDGDLVIIDEMGEDIAQIVDIVKMIDDAGVLASVGLDPAGVGAVIDALAEAGIEGGDKVFAVSQGYRLNAAVKTAERKLADLSLVHCGQPLMSWSVSNAKTELRGSATVITKAASGTAKIDPLMATFNAVQLMSGNPEPTSKHAEIFVLG